jgi:hypothetical protein
MPSSGPQVEAIEWLDNTWKAHIRRRGRLYLGVGLAGIIIFVLAFVLAAHTSPSDPFAEAIVVSGWAVGLLASSGGMALSIGGSGDLRKQSQVPDRVGIAHRDLRMEYVPPRTEHQRSTQPWVRDSVPWDAMVSVRVPYGFIGPVHEVRFELKDGGSYSLHRVSMEIADRIKAEFDHRAGRGESSPVAH